MIAQKKVLPGIGKILYGIGGLAAITEVVFLLLFLPGFSSVNEVSLIICATLGLALPVLIMPLCYALVNGNTAIATGKYHLIMSAAALIAALSFVFLPGGIGKAHAVAQGFAVGGISFIYSLSAQIFAYAYFSVGQRFDKSGAALTLSNVFSVIALPLAALTVLWLYDGSRDSVRAIAAFASVITVLCAVSAYFSSVKAMPAYIRLEPRHKRKIKESYAIFVSPLKYKAVCLFVCASVFVFAGVGVAAATLPSYVFSYALSGAMSKIACAIAVALFTGVSIATVRCVRGVRANGVGIAFAALSSVTVVLAAGAAAVVIISVPAPVIIAVMLAFAAAAGATLGIALSCENASREHAVMLTGCTRGRYGCFINCAAAIGMSLGVALSAATRIIHAHMGMRIAAVISCALVGLLPLFGSLLSRTGFMLKLPVRENEESANESVSEEKSNADG